MATRMLTTALVMFLCFSVYVFKIKEKYGIKAKASHIAAIKASNSSNNHSEVDVVLDGYDLVAIYENQENKHGLNEFSYPYANVKLLFASKDNLKKFGDNPYQYMPAYSGYDAYELSDNKLVTGIAEFARNINGKTYLFASAENRDMFSLIKNEAIEKANANWQERRK